MDYSYALDRDIELLRRRMAAQINHEMEVSRNMISKEFKHKIEILEAEINRLRGIVDLHNQKLINLAIKGF